MSTAVLQPEDLAPAIVRHLALSKATRRSCKAAFKRLRSMLDKVDETLRASGSGASPINSENLPPTTRLSASQAAAPLPYGEATAGKRHKDAPGLGLAAAQLRKPSKAALAARYANISKTAAAGSGPTATAIDSASALPRSPAACTSGPAATAGKPGSPGKRGWQPAARADPDERNSSSDSQESDVEMVDAQEFASVSQAVPAEARPQAPGAHGVHDATGLHGTTGGATSGSGGHRTAANGRPLRRVADIQPATPHAPLKPSSAGKRSPAGPPTPRAEAVHSGAHHQQAAAEPIVLSSDDDEEVPQQRPSLNVRPSPQRPQAPHGGGAAPREAPAASAGATGAASGKAAVAEPGLTAVFEAAVPAKQGAGVESAPATGRGLGSGSAAPAPAAAVPRTKPSVARNDTLFHGGAAGGKAAAQPAERARGAAARKGKGKHFCAPASSPSAAFRFEVPGAFAGFSQQTRPAASFGLRVHPPQPAMQQQPQVPRPQSQQGPPQLNPQQVPVPQPRSQPAAQSSVPPTASAGQAVGAGADAPPSAAQQTGLGDQDDGYDDLLAQQARRCQQAQAEAGEAGEADAAAQQSQRQQPPQPQQQRRQSHSMSPGEGTQDDPFTLLTSSDDDESNFEPQRTRMSSENFHDLFKDMAQKHQHQKARNSAPAFGAGNGAFGQLPSRSSAAAANVSFTGATGVSQKARRPQVRRKPGEPFKRAPPPSAIPANPPFAPPPPQPVPVAAQQPQSSTWGPPRQSTRPSSSGSAAAPQRSAQPEQPPLFRGQPGAASDGMAQRKSPKKSAYSAKAGARTSVPPPQPGGGAATGWPPKQWKPTQAPAHGSPEPMAWAQQTAAAAANSGAAAAEPPASAGSTPAPVFSGSTAAAAERAVRASRPVRQPARRANAPKPAATRATASKSSVPAATAATSRPTSATATTAAEASGPATGAGRSAAMPRPAPAAEMSAVSEATRAAFGAYRLDDEGPPGMPARAADDSYDEGADQSGAPEVLREQHRNTDAARDAEAREWEQRQIEINKQNAEAKRLKMQRKAAAAQKHRVEERLQEHRQLEIKKAEEAKQKDGLRTSLQAALQRRLQGFTTLRDILRVLQLPIEGEPNPTSAQLEKAKKKAQIKFHPDRYQGKPVQMLIEAEEIFKIINDAPMNAPPATYRSHSHHSSYSHTSHARTYGYGSYSSHQGGY